MTNEAIVVLEPPKGVPLFVLTASQKGTVDGQSTRRFEGPIQSSDGGLDLGQ
jgi:hypothetical protein